MRLALSGFGGANRALQPRLLADNVGVESANQRPGRGDLRGWKLPNVVATIPAGRKTIYRMGRDTVSDTASWLSWNTVVHAVRGFIAADTSERTYYTGDGAPKVTDNVLALATAPYPTDWRWLGVPAPISAPLPSETTAGTGTDETRVYVYTYVTDKGEESAPSPPSIPITTKPTGSVITLTNLDTTPPADRGVTLVRIYRTKTGTSGSTSYFFLREIAAGVASTTDDGRALGEVVPTVGWAPPPADLKHLHGLWNGMLAGITGRSVRYCEPFTPYAWPAAYETLINDDTPVALGSYQQTLVVLTTGKPRIVSGTSPEGMQDQGVDGLSQACVSERSVQSFGHGVVYASPDGLAYVGVAGPPRVLTAGIMLPEDWRALKPETIVGAQYEGIYFGFYNDGSGLKGFFVDPVSPQGIYFLDTGYEAAFADPLTDALYVVAGTNVQKWHAASSFMTARWRSKPFRMPAPTNLGYAEVTADAYPVTFKLYGDGVLRFTKTVTSREPFAMPSGYLADEFAVEVEAPAGRGVQGVALAESVLELATL
jgi:hypothetical protein